MDDVVTALIGLAGAVMGAGASAYATGYTTRRDKAHVAARLAHESLQHWTDASDLLRQRERQYPRDDTYEIRMAIVVAAVRDFLTLDWWDANREGLCAVADDREWAILVAAAKACRGLVMLLADVGDVVEDVSMRRARVLAEGKRPPKPAADPEDSGGLSLSEAQQEAAEAKRASDDIRAEFDELPQSLRLFVATLDHRLWLVQDVRAKLLSADEKIQAAADVCAAIEQRTTGVIARQASPQ